MDLVCFFSAFIECTVADDAFLMIFMGFYFSGVWGSLYSSVRVARS